MSTTITTPPRHPSMGHTKGLTPLASKSTHKAKISTPKRSPAISKQNSKSSKIELLANSDEENSVSRAFTQGNDSMIRPSTSSSSTRGIQMVNTSILNNKPINLDSQVSPSRRQRLTSSKLNIHGDNTSTAVTARGRTPSLPTPRYNLRRHTHSIIVRNELSSNFSEDDEVEDDSFFQTTSEHTRDHYSKRPQSSYLMSRQSRASLFSLQPSSFISSTQLSPATKEINNVMNDWVTKNKILDLTTDEQQEMYLSSSQPKEIIDDDIDKLLKNTKNRDAAHVNKKANQQEHGVWAKSNASSHPKKRTSQSSIFPSRMTVEQKIEKIKTDNLAKKRLMERISEHEKMLRKERKEKSSLPNKVKEYVEELSNQYTTEYIQNKKEEYLRKWNENHQIVLERHYQQQVQLKEQLELTWEEGTRKREYAELKRATFEMKRKLEKRQRLWYPAIILGSTVSKWCTHMLEKRKEREYLRRRERAKATLKKYILPRVFERRAQRKEQAMEVIQSNMLLWCIGHRVRQKKHSVRVIVSCISSLQDSNKFSKQVAVFLHHVKTSQRSLRDHLNKRDSQLFFIRKIWEKVEVDVYARQKQSDFEEYKEKICMELEQLLAVIEGHSIDQSKATSVKESMKKTKTIIIQSKKMLKRAIDMTLEKDEIKKQIRQNAELILTKLRNKELSNTKIDKLGALFTVLKRERFVVLPHIRDMLILQDIIRRSREHREFVRKEKQRLEQQISIKSVRNSTSPSADESDSRNSLADSSDLTYESDNYDSNEISSNEIHDPFYFNLFPSVSVIENLILQGQQLSKEEIQKRAAKEETDSPRPSSASSKSKSKTRPTSASSTNSGKSANLQ